MTEFLGDVFFVSGKQYIRVMSSVTRFDGDDVMCRHHKPRLISNPVDNNQVQRQSWSTQRLMRAIHHARAAAVYNTSSIIAALVCRYFDTLRDSALFLASGHLYIIPVSYQSPVT